MSIKVNRYFLVIIISQPIFFSHAYCRHKEFKMTTIARYFSNREAVRLPTLHSQNLFALTKEVRIEHQGEEYRLRLTRNNRLILTK